MLTIVPSGWRSALALDLIARDTFVSLLHREIHFGFNRDDTDGIESLTVWGHPRGEIEGRAPRLLPRDIQPVELLLSGDAAAALRMLREHGAGTERLTQLGFMLVQNFPSMGRTGAEFLEAASAEVEPEPNFYFVMALGWLRAGERNRALTALARASELDPEDRSVRHVRQLIDPSVEILLPDSAWSLPFELDDLFAPPTTAEIQAVRADWRERDLAAHAVTFVAQHEYSTPPAFANGESVAFEVRIISHQVQGSRHYGAALVPIEPGAECCAVVLEAHGIDWAYSGLDLNDIETPAILGSAGRNTVILVPSFRGEELRLDDASYKSEGDPRGGWDGAVDDAISFLSSALEVVPEADADRVCVFGKSRGGTVAMLTAIRDDRVKCVVGWTGPAGWFEHMGTFGFTLQEQVQWALWERWVPGEGWGSAAQILDWGLRESLNATSADLAAVRHQMLAGSPVYFLDDLPPAQLHYGREDGSVPVANAYALREVLEARENAVPFEVHIHDGAGHDMPYPRAYLESAAFLRTYLAARE